MLMSAQYAKSMPNPKRPCFSGVSKTFGRRKLLGIQNSLYSNYVNVHIGVKEYAPNKSAWKWIPFVLVMLFAANRIEVWNKSSQYPDKFVIHNFPLHKQPDKITCGPTSLKMLLEYYGKEHSVDEIKKKTKTELFVYQGEKIGGTAPDQMKQALSHFDVPGELVHADIHKLKKHVSEGRPCIALVRTGKMMWHWLVVIGYEEGKIYTADPSSGKKKVRKTSIFQKAWKFTHDLRGRDMSSKCPVCKGTGNLAEWLGPFGTCEICGGDGKTIDIFWTFVELGEAKGCTLIVPKEKPYELDTSGS